MAPADEEGEEGLELPDFVAVEFLLGGEGPTDEGPPEEDPLSMVVVSVATTVGAVVVSVLVMVILFNALESVMTETEVLEVLEIEDPEGVVEGVVDAEPDVPVALVVIVPGEPGQLA